MIDQQIVDKMRRFMEARDKRDESKRQAEQDERDYREIEAEVWDMLDESALEPPYKINLGQPWGKVRFDNRATHYGRVIDEDAAIEGFEQRAVIEEYTHPKIVMQRVNEEVRDAIEQGNPMPPGIDFYTRRFVSVTKEKGA